MYVCLIALPSCSVDSELRMERGISFNSFLKHKLKQKSVQVLGMWETGPALVNQPAVFKNPSMTSVHVDP